jgi:hypothetical protein
MRSSVFLRYSCLLLAAVLAAFDLVGREPRKAAHAIGRMLAARAVTTQPRHHGGALLGDSTRDGIVHAYDRVPSLQTL